MTAGRDGTALIERVREVAAERPDFTYVAIADDEGRPGCYYRKDGEPSCIMGHALSRLGIAVHANQESRSITEVAWHYEIVLTDEQGEWLETVQEEQDSGYRWSDAINRADAEIEL